MKAISLLTAATITFAGLALAPKADAQVIKIDGSSTVFPISEAVAEEFQIQKARQGRASRSASPAPAAASRSSAAARPTSRTPRARS